MSLLPHEQIQHREDEQEATTDLNGRDPPLLRYHKRRKFKVHGQRAIYHNVSLSAPFRAGMWIQKWELPLAGSARLPWCQHGIIQGARDSHEIEMRGCRSLRRQLEQRVRRVKVFRKGGVQGDEKGAQMVGDATLVVGTRQNFEHSTVKWLAWQIRALHEILAHLRGGEADVDWIRG